MIRVLLLAACLGWAQAAGPVQGHPAPGGSPPGGPDLGQGNCLSCHGATLPVLPRRPCISCHARSMAFRDDAGLARTDGPWHVLLGVWGAGSLLLLGFAVAAFRRDPAARRFPSAAWGTAGLGGLGLAACAAVLVAAGRIPPGWNGARWFLRVRRVAAPGPAPLDGAVMAGQGVAADLWCAFAPDGASALVQDPDPAGGRRLTLWTRDGRRIAVAGHLGFTGPMAAWSPDGRRFVLPVPEGGRIGLALFRADGILLDRLPAGPVDLLDPCFSRDGGRIAFTEGDGLGIWEPGAGRRPALAPLRDGTFPRLLGWDPGDRFPVFTRGREYAVTERQPDRRYRLPAQIPLEGAVAGRALLLTPAALQRTRGTACPEGLAYLAQETGKPRILHVLDGGCERAWSPLDRWVYAFEPCPGGGFWAFLAAGKGQEAYFARIPAPGQVQVLGGPFQPHLLALSGGASPVVSAPSRDASRPLRTIDAKHGLRERPTGASACFGPASAGSARAFVLVARDTDGDGRLSPSDDGVLWIHWSEP